ncbi:MAG: hypothetical protein ITG00_02165 [Flavobacterium sp.]|nr:hypothetical protein [Flavobacterium sp.]
MNYFFKPPVFFLFFLFAILPITAVAQDFASVDKKVNGYSKSFASPEKLAEKINADFKRDDEKARAAFTWIALNIRYDLGMLNSNEPPARFSFRTQEERLQKQKQFDIDLAEKTLRSKKAVCDGYSMLFNRLAELCGIESVMIPGTSKSHPSHIGKLPAIPDHAWNAVKIDGKWQLVDVTWGAGGVNGATGKFEFKFNPGYFFTHPTLFFFNHFPSDKQWLFLDKSEQDFAALPLYYGDYIQSAYTIVSPIGSTVPNNESVRFTIDSLGELPVTYVLSNERMVRQVTPEKRDDLSIFEIKLDSRATGYLTIYIDHKSVVTYKIGRSVS